MVGRIACYAATVVVIHRYRKRGRWTWNPGEIVALQRLVWREQVARPRCSRGIHLDLESFVSESRNTAQGVEFYHSQHHYYAIV